MMPDLLIPHMELPKDNKINIIMFDSEGNVDEQSKHFGCYYHLDAKAQEIPAHGDLIDRKSSVERFHKLSEIYDLALQDCGLEKRSLSTLWSSYERKESSRRYGYENSIRNACCCQGVRGVKMSDILISNWKMPSCCNNCFLVDKCSAHARKVDELLKTDIEHLYSYFTDRRMEDCPLIEIPFHDDLISRSDAVDAAYGWHVNNHPMKELEELPAIVPRNDGKENRRYYSDETRKPMNMWDGY